jgi:rhodanese-related sulfurtransferase
MTIRNEEIAMIFLHRLLIAAALVVGFAALATAQDAPVLISGATTVNARQIFDLIDKSPNIVILDNRKEEDFAAGHIESAIRLIDTEVTAETLARHIAAKDTPVLFYCNGVKCGRAAKATEKAVQFGYTKVYYYALGMDEWNKEGLPVFK